MIRGVRSVVVAASLAALSGQCLAQAAPPPPRPPAWKPTREGGKDVVPPAPVGAAKAPGLDANPPDSVRIETEIVADADSAIKDGFIMDETQDEHIGDPMRDIVMNEFMPAIGAPVGRKIPLEFSFDLMDLTGSGYNSLVLWPRVWELYPPNGLGTVYIYGFDGKTWHLALKGYAMLIGVRPAFDDKRRPTGAMDVALVSSEGYVRWVYDKDKREYHEAPH